MKKVVAFLSSLTSPSASLSDKHIHRLDTIQQKSLLNSPGPFFKHMITTVDLSLAFSFFVMLIRALQPILSYSHQGRKALGKALAKPPPKVPPTTPNADAASFSFSASSLAFSSAFFFFLCNFMCTSPQALHSVLGPIGPLLHSGVSVAPQPKHVGGGPFFLSPEFPLFLPAMVFPDRAPVLPAEPLLPCFPFPILTPFPWLALFEVGLT